MANNLVVQLLLKTGAFSNDLRTAKGQIQSFQNSCKSAGGILDNFTKGLGINIGSLSKFGAATAVAAGAGKVLKDAFQSNTDMMDKFNTSMEKAKSTYKTFVTQMFGNSKINIDFKGVSEQAKEYYDAIDYSQVAMSAITTELKLQEVEYNRLLATAMNVSLSEVDRLEALNEAGNAMARQLQLKRQLAQIDKMVAKETLESGVVNRGVNKTWLEGAEGQRILKEFSKVVQDENGQWMYEFDRYFNSVDTSRASTGRISGQPSEYERTIEMMKNAAGAEAVSKKAQSLGLSVNEYLEKLRKESETATETVNSMKYKLAEALHNFRSENGGLEAISKYITLYLEDMGISQIDAEQASADATIERLRKRITGKDGSKIIYKDGSIGKIEEEITKLKQKIKEATEQDVRDALMSEVEALQATLDVMNGKKDAVFTKGSVEWLNAEISRVQGEMDKLDLGLPDTNNILQKMNDWTGEWEDFVINLSEEEYKLFSKFSDVMNQRWNMMNTISSYKAAADSANGKKTVNKPTTLTYSPGSYGYRRDALESQIKDEQDFLKYAIGLPPEEIQNSISLIKKLQEELNQLDIDFGFKNVDTGKNQWDDLNKTLMNTSSIASNLSQVFSSTGDNIAASILNMVSTSLPAIGQLISAVYALTSAEAVQAGVEGTKKAIQSSQHWIEAIAAITAIGAAVATSIASAKNMGKFANGGIVGGSSFTGDRLTASVNSGEMILSRSQQMKLFRQINGGENKNTGNVQFHISGTDLVGVLDNFNRKQRVIR